MNLSGTAYHPDFGQLVAYQAIPLSEDPDTQVAQTIDMMRRYVKADSGSAPIQQEAAELALLSAGDPCSEVFDYIKGKVGFQRDEVTAAPIRPLLDGDVVEVLIRPRDLAQMYTPREDCDGFEMYGPALLRALGVKCNLVTVAADPREPSRYSHVYAACYPNGERIALDMSHGPYPGWEAPDLYGKKREWPIDGWDLGDLAGFALLAFGAFLLARGMGVL